MSHNYQRRQRATVIVPVSKAQDFRLHEIDRVVTGYYQAYKDLYGVEALLIHERAGWYTISGTKFRLSDLERETRHMQALHHERNMTEHLPEKD